MSDSRPPTVVLRPRIVWARLGISAATGWRRVRDDSRFPRPIRVGANACGFIEAELERYIETLVAERDERWPDAAA